MDYVLAVTYLVIYGLINNVFLYAFFDGLMSERSHLCGLIFEMLRLSLVFV